MALIVLIPRTESPLQSYWADMFVADPTLGRVAKGSRAAARRQHRQHPAVDTDGWEIALSLAALRGTSLWRSAGGAYWHLKLGIVLAL